MKNKSVCASFRKSIGVFIISAFFVSVALIAQVPDKISYQAIIRNSSHSLAKDQQIGIKFSILQGQPDGSVVYTEVQYLQTNINGLLSSGFGGEPGFELINWANGPFFLEVAIDIEGGEDYSITATTQMLSVPYALHASSAGTLTRGYVSEEGDPVFQASIAAGISQNEFDNWNTAFSWGDHDNLYLHYDWVPDWSQVTNRPEKISDLILDAGGNIISNLAPAVEPSDAVNKEYVDFLLKRIGVLENFLNMGASFEIPTIVLDNVFQIEAFTATATATVTDNGGAELLYARGFVWNTSEDPDLNNNAGITNDGKQMGDFTSMLTGLLPLTTYYIRAYATNVSGTAYSEQFSFATLNADEIVIDIDNNIYQTIEMNGIRWMAENLKVTRYNDGSPIPKGLSNSEWYTTNSGAYAIYPDYYVDGINSEMEMLMTYGALYNWMAATDPKGLCPAGWRLPTDEEWKATEKAMGMNDNELYVYGWRGTDQGGKLKSTRTAPDAHPRWDQPNTLAMDVYGYSSVPAGFREYDGSFRDLGEGAAWWTSTTNAGVSAWYRSNLWERGSIGRFYGWNRYGFSVRCIK